MRSLPLCPLLVQGITGCFRPGVLTALMGSSGAGKVREVPRGDSFFLPFLLLFPSTRKCSLGSSCAGKVRGGVQRGQAAGEEAAR